MTVRAPPAGNAPRSDVDLASASRDGAYRKSQRKGRRPRARRCPLTRVAPAALPAEVVRCKLGLTAMKLERSLGGHLLLPFSTYAGLFLHC
jgi:hypothetical protein